MIYKMTLKDSADEMTFDLLEVPIVDKDIEGAVDNVTIDGNQYTDYLWLKKQFIQKWSILCDDEYTRLRGFYTRQFENADVPSYRLYYGDDIIRNSTLSGERIELSISGVADGTMSLTQMDGNIEQDGTPTPSAPVPVQTVTGRQTVTVAGKNILDYVTYFRSGTYNGITATLNDDGSITISGKPTSNYVQIVSVHDITDLLEDGATYSLSSDGHDRRLIGQFQRRPKNGGGTQYIDTITGDKTVTIDKSNNNYSIGVMTVTTTDWGNDPLTITRTFQFEKGSVTSFEPFEGQAHEINLGKNLIEPRMPTWTYNGVTCTNNGDGSFTLNGTATATATWRIEQSTANGHDHLRTLNGTYTLSCKGIQTGVSLIATQFNVWQTIGRVQNNETPSTFTSNLNDTLVYIAVTNGTTVNNVTVYPQLERGGIASSYSPHFEPIELCKIGTYQDRIYKENGKWWLYKEIGKVVLDGSEAWIARSGATSYAYAVPDVFDGNKPNGISDHFRFIQGGASSGQSVECIASASTTNAVSVFTNNSSMDTVANFETWLASNNVTIYYTLATPTTTKITNEEVLEGLDSLLLESISVGQHNIYTDTPNALPTLTFDLTEYLSKSTTIIPETAVRLTLTDGGVINACGCRKDVQLTMRETIE